MFVLHAAKALSVCSLPCKYRKVANERQGPADAAICLLMGSRKPLAWSSISGRLSKPEHHRSEPANCFRGAVPNGDLKLLRFPLLQPDGDGCRVKKRHHRRSASWREADGACRSETSIRYLGKHGRERLHFRDTKMRHFPIDLERTLTRNFPGVVTKEWR